MGFGEPCKAQRPSSLVVMSTEARRIQGLRGLSALHPTVSGSARDACIGKCPTPLLTKLVA